MSRHLILAATTILALAQAGAVFAQTARPPEPTKPALNLSDAHVSIGPAGGQVTANRTSVDRTFGPQALTVSAGYLCGLQPLSDRTPGPASTFGPVSTFLGGKLSYAFK